VLALLGSAAALLLTYWTGGLIGSLLARRVAHVDTIPINGRVLGFTVATALATALLSSIASIATARSSDLVTAVKRNGTSFAGGRTGIGRSLLVAETAGTFILVVAAVLLVQTLWNLHRARYGFDATGVVTASITPSMQGTTGERQQFIASFFRDLMERASALPGVESAGVASIVPLSGLSIGMSGVTVVGQPSAGEGTSVSVAFVTPGYFHTLRTRLTGGRDFTGSDQTGAERVAIVNEVLRGALDADPAIGKQIQFGRDIVTVVGVVEDVPNTSLREAARPVVYLPVAQMPGTNFVIGRLKLVARTGGFDPAGLVPAMREAVWGLRHDVVVDEVTTMDELMAAAVRNERDGMLLFGVLALVTLAVAAAGVYGAVAYAVSRRTREIGIRIALGASPRAVVARIIGDGLWPVCVGVVIGVFGGVAATRSIGSLLYGTEPTDARAFAATAVILITAALLAAGLPARRAARVDPAAALRSE
jgi:predicted permease